MKPGRIALSGFWVLAGIAGQFSARADDQSLEEIVVTGTRLARPNFDSASPIVTVTADVFERTGSGTAETTLNRYPQFVPAKTGTSSAFPDSDGESNLNLRGLGAKRTLTLVQGRRLTPVNGDGETDVNVIPPALIERAEILTGGASAVYGSDAIAGVVNLPLRREFDGVELRASGVQTDHGDGQEYDVSLTAGTRFAEGRGSVMGYIAYYDRAQDNATARSFYPAELRYVGPGNGIAGPDRAYVGKGDPTIEEGVTLAAEDNLYNPEVFDSLFETYGYPSGTVEMPQPIGIGFNTDGTVFTTGNFDPDSVVNFRGQGDPLTSNSFKHTYNFAPYEAIQMPLTRTSAFAAVNFDLNENLELYADGIYADYKVNKQWAPVPLVDVFMPPTNPFIPQDFRLLLDSRLRDRGAPFIFRKRMTVLGPRVYENNYDMHQLAVGVRGRLPGDWVVNAYAQYGASSQWKYQTGNISRSKVEELTFAPDGGVAICGGFDIFGLNSVEPRCAAYVGVNAGISADVRQAVAEVWARGLPLALPAGEVGMALGLQYRKEEYEYRADDALRKVLPDGNADVIGIALGDNIDAEDHNVDMYVEAAIPLLADLPGVQSLETVLGFRRSDYASAGHTDTWKAELLYQPVTAFRLRGSYQRAVRAPSINELFRPATSDFGFFPSGEPCSSTRVGPDRQLVEALCIEQGVPAEVLPDYYSEQIPINVRGNPDLAPEVGETLTAGLIVRPGFEQPWLRELQFTVDWYQIEIENTVTEVDAVTAVENCFDPRYNPNYAATNYWCTLFGRDPDSGNLIEGTKTFYNLARTMTSGVDFQLDWQIPAGPGGLQVGWYVAWLAEDLFQTRRDSPTERSVGTIGGFGGARPEWKWLMDLRYAWGQLEFGAGWQYIDSTRDTSRTEEKTEDHVVPHQDYFNADASYTFDEGWFNGSTVHIGVVNLTDEPPPVFPGWVAFNTDPSQYDVLGRRYFVSLALRF